MRTMSVPGSQRGESKAEFLNSAYDLHVMTIKLCMKMDKRLTLLLKQEICHWAAECHAHAKAANSVFPRNKMDAQKRRDHLTEANCAVQALYSLLDVAKGLNQITATKVTENELTEWLDLAAAEAKLLAAVKESDLERYKDLPPGPM